MRTVVTHEQQRRDFDEPSTDTDELPTSGRNAREPKRSKPRQRALQMDSSGCLQLSDAQRSWMETDAPLILGITRARARMLLLAVQTQQFTFRELSDDVQVTREAVRKSFRLFHRRGLVRLRNVTPRTYSAEPGEALLMLLAQLPRSA